MGWFDDRLHDDAVPHDRFDEMAWRGMVMESPDLDRMVRDWQRRYDYAGDFALDAFNLIVKGDPRIRQPEEMNPTHLPLRAVTKGVAGMTELARLKTWTIGDPFSAAMAMKVLEPALTDALKRAQELAERAQEAQEALQAAQEAAEAAGFDPAAQEGAQEAAAAAEQLITTLGHEAEAASAHVRAGIRAGLNKAGDAAEEMEEAMGAYGVGPGELQRMSFAERAALARRLRGKKLAEFARLIGAFRRLATTEWRHRYVDGADEVFGVKLGNDLARLTTQEQINLCLPEMQDDFWRRWAEGTLLVHETRGRERAGKGPMVVVVDESDSMSGQPEAWAKGLALALLDQARRGQRDYHYVGFGGPLDPLRVFSFPEGRAATQEVLDLAEGFLAGGTEFAKPLRRALDIAVATAQARPDIVFITDGQAPLPSFLKEWDQVRQRLSIRCYGVFISKYAGVPDVLERLCDSVRTLADVTDIYQAQDILRAG